MVAVELGDLAEAHVDCDEDGHCPNVESLAEDAAFRGVGACVTDVGEVWLRVP